jgi:hypothetical protein
MKVSVLTASGLALGLAVAVTACSTGAKPTASATSPGAGSSPASTAAPVTTSVPAGYRRVGGPAQGISLAVPKSWIAADLAKETAQRAAARLRLRGISQQQLVQTLEGLQKVHALFLIDSRSVLTDAHHRATNINAYCLSSGVSDTGSAGVPLLKQQVLAEFRQLNADHIVQKDVRVGGVPGVQTSYRVTTSAGTVQAAQLEVLPKPDRACFVTLTAGQGKLPADVLPVAAETAVFS